MFTQEHHAYNSKATEAGHAQPHVAAPGYVDVNVKLPYGSQVQAWIRDMSPFGGVHLLFEKDPQLEVGSVISVSNGLFPSTGVIRHIGTVGGKHWADVSWWND